MRKMMILTLATLGATLFTSAAYAEPKKEKSQDYGYTFTDDALLGNDIGGQYGLIKVRQTGVRDKLIRPRGGLSLTSPSTGAQTRETWCVETNSPLSQQARPRPQASGRASESPPRAHARGPRRSRTP